MSPAAHRLAQDQARVQEGRAAPQIQSAGSLVVGRGRRFLSRKVSLWSQLPLYHRATEGLRNLLACWGLRGPAVLSGGGWGAGALES